VGEVISRESTVARRIQSELACASVQLRSAGVATPRQEALEFLSELADVTPGTVLAGLDWTPNEGLLRRFRKAVRRRAEGEPRQYVVGTVGFRRLILRCDARALIPRPETEGLIDLALAHQPTGRALDLGTGSGCLALALADEGAYREVVGVDVSPAALALARENAVRTGLPVRWLEGEWTAPVRGERFDVIVTNPPYIATSEWEGLDRLVRDWEPRLALDGGSDGMAEVRRLLLESPAVLRSGGWLFMEVDAARAAGSAELARAVGWRAVRVLDDVYQRPRYLAAQWEPHDAR
jgi:release factor glutamine methyltransferase